MAALESAERTVRALREFPLLFGAAGLFAVLKLPVEVTRPLRITYDVYAVLALLTFLFTPVLLSGLYGLAVGALENDARASFWEAVGDGYGNLLLANAVYALVQHVLLLFFALLAAVTFLGLVGGVGATVDPTLDPETAREIYGAAGFLATGGVVFVSFVYLVVRFTVAFFMQLYKPSAAVGGNDPVAAFAESASLVREHPESTLGFVLLRLFAMVVLVLPGVVAVVAMLFVQSSLLGQLDQAATGVVVAAVLVVGFAVGVVELAFLSTYRVAFYRSLVES
jgi:hypothetical protein